MRDQLTPLFLLSAYFLPTLIAWVRTHWGTNSIAVVNLFLGWTFVGWVVCLAWAVHGRHRHADAL